MKTVVRFPSWGHGKDRVYDLTDRDHIIQEIVATPTNWDSRGDLNQVMDDVKHLRTLITAMLQGASLKAWRHTLQALSVKIETSEN